MDMKLTPWQKRQGKMKIGFAGSAGTGKTTLAKEIAKHLDYKYSSEGVREYIEKSRFKSLKNLRGKPKACFQMQLQLAYDAMMVESQTDQIVCDRTTLDNAAYTLFWLGREPELQEGIISHIQACAIHAISEYDLIVVLPFGDFPLEDDGTRSVLPAYQMLMQSLIEHSVHQGYPYYFVHQVKSLDRDERVVEVLNLIDQMVAEKKKNESSLIIPSSGIKVVK